MFENNLKQGITSEGDSKIFDLHQDLKNTLKATFTVAMPISNLSEYFLFFSILTEVYCFVLFYRF